MTLGIFQVLLLVCVIICGTKFHHVKKQKNQIEDSGFRFTDMTKVSRDQLHQLDMSYSLLMTIIIVSLFKFFFVALGLCADYTTILFISFLGDTIVTGLYAAHLSVIKEGFKPEASCGTLLSLASAFITLYLLKRIRLADI